MPGLVVTLAVAIALGLAVPDFRYDVFSIVVIQLVRPIVFAVPAIYEIVRSNTLSRQRVLLGAIALVLCNVVGFGWYYVEAPESAVHDGMTDIIIIYSFAAQLIAFLGTIAFSKLVLMRMRRRAE